MPTNTPKRGDTTRTARSAKRVAALNAIAQAHGFASWRRLETAALNGKVTIIVKDSEE